MKIPGRNIRFDVRTKIILTVSVLLIASVVAVSSYLIHSQTASYQREVETNGETMIRIFAVQAETGVLLESRYELDELLNQLLVFGNVQYAEIKNIEGTILSRLGEWDDTRIVRRRATYLAKRDNQSEADSRITDKDGRQFIDLQYPIFSRIETVDRENLGITTNLDDRVLKDVTIEEIGTMRLILSLDDVEKAASEAKMAAIVVTAIVLALTILVLTLLARAITRPLRILVQITDKVSQGDLNQKVEIDQHDEIGHLARTFSNMIESLKASRDEIEEYNRNLEQKIIERTLALEEAQSQLVQSEKMSAIGQLAAGVAHELNNPLGGILGYAQFALEKMKRQLADTPDNKEMQSYVRYLGDIESQSRRCKNIVQNLLRFSRSTRTSEFEDVDLNQVIQETKTFVEHQLHMKQIDLVVELDPDLPEVPANAGQLQQVFTNLIINAMHASPPETTIKIITRSSPALGEFGGAVEILFVDQGCGIPIESVKKVFEPFFTTKDVGQGTGLGLSVSYGIVKDHGGEISVISKPGEGTTFSIILPLQKPPADSDSQEHKFLAPLDEPERRND